MKSFASEVNCRIMVYEKPTAILAWLLGGEAFRELLRCELLSPSEAPWSTTKSDGV